MNVYVIVNNGEIEPNVYTSKTMAARAAGINRNTIIRSNGYYKRNGLQVKCCKVMKIKGRGKR